MKICNCWNNDNKNDNNKNNLTLGHSSTQTVSTDQWNTWRMNKTILNPNPTDPTIPPKTLKEKFISDYESKNGRVKYIVMAIQGVDGEIEIDVHAYGLSDKFKWYCNMYYDNFESKSNVMIKVVGYLIV